MVATTPFPGGPFPVSGAHLGRVGIGPSGIFGPGSTPQSGLVPMITIPQYGVDPVLRASGITRILSSDIRTYSRFYEDFTGLVDPDTGDIIPSGTKIFRYPKLTAGQRANQNTHKLLELIKAHYNPAGRTYGKAQTGGSAIVAPSGGTQVLFPGQSSSGVV
tara:strand:+ start:2707 stop:3189 length:483 start_codon:yes stop_codon:yes gene_type:complete